MDINDRKPELLQLEPGLATEPSLTLVPYSKLGAFKCTQLGRRLHLWPQLMAYMCPYPLTCNFVCFPILTLGLAMRLALVNGIIQNVIEEEAEKGAGLFLLPLLNPVLGCWRMRDHVEES